MTGSTRNRMISPITRTIAMAVWRTTTGISRVVECEQHNRPAETVLSLASDEYRGPRQSVPGLNGAEPISFFPVGGIRAASKRCGEDLIGPDLPGPGDEPPEIAVQVPRCRSAEHANEVAVSGVERVHVLDVMRRRGKTRPRLAPHHQMF